LGYGTYKAAKGLIKVNIQGYKEKIKEIQISGDFFTYPEDRLWDLERNLLRTLVEREKILSKVKDFYRKTNLLNPGVAPEDFTEAIVRGIDKVTS